MTARPLPSPAAVRVLADELLERRRPAPPPAPQLRVVQIVTRHATTLAPPEAPPPVTLLPAYRWPGALPLSREGDPTIGHPLDARPLSSSPPVPLRSYEEARARLWAGRAYCERCRTIWLTREDHVCPSEEES